MLLLLGSSKVIYLDQNKWSEVAKYLSGIHNHQNPNLDLVCNKMLDKINSGLWLFPISMVHIMETLNYSNQDVNQQLVEMLTNRLFQLGDFTDVLKDEIIRNLDGKPPLTTYITECDFLPDFGGRWELEICDGQGDIDKNAIENFKDFYRRYYIPYLLNDDKSIFKALEMDEDLIKKIEDDTKAKKQTYATLLDFGFSMLQNQSKEYTDYKKLYGKKQADAICRMFLFDGLCAGLYENNSQIQQIISFDNYKRYSLSTKCKSFNVYSSLVLHLLSNTPERIKKNDYQDIWFLSVAIPYCDVIITEKKWTNVIKDKMLDSQYNTFISKSLLDLLDIE